jgi:tyrosyl-tRNA synthetase
LDAKKTKVVFNSSWFTKMTSSEILELTSFSSVAQVLARADFKERFESKKEISILEFIYPLLQAYDSVYLKADVELGGTDQKFNLLMGRQLQNSFNQPQQVVMMTPLLEGLDGINKMSKSLGNYVGICDDPKDMLGKIMSIDDKLMMRYYELLTDEDLERVKNIHPKEAKLNLAQILVSQFHASEKARIAREEFEKVFKEKKLPEDILEYKFSVADKRITDILCASGTTASANEARRLIREGAVYFNDKKISENWQIEEGILKVGKRRFLKLVRSK